MKKFYVEIFIIVTSAIDWNRGLEIMLIISPRNIDGVEAVSGSTETPDFISCLKHLLG